MASRPAASSSAVLIAECEQRGRVGVAERQGSGGDLRVFSLTPDEAAADRVVRLFSESVPVDPERSERHGIRMPRQPRARSELDVVLLERDRVRPIDEQRQASFRSRRWRRSAGVQVSGASPRRPATTASGVPCPMPVAPREPYRVHVTRLTSPSEPPELRRRAKSSAARIGPTVCELDGPTPMEKKSKAETYAVTCPGYAPQAAPRRALRQTDDMTSDVPLYRRVADRLAHRIVDGEFPIGTLLPGGVWVHR